MESEHPLTRQMRLAEVGADGQARLSRATMSVRGSDGSLVELVYLHRAGVECVSIDSHLPARPFLHASLFRHSGTRQLAAGAWRALGQMRSVLGLDLDLR